MGSVGDTIGSMARDVEDMKQSLTPHGAIPIYFLHSSFGYNFKQVNLLIKKLDYSASNTFILDHPINGILDTATGMGGGQVLLDGAAAVTTELTRRRYEWRTESDLANGTYDPNISTDDGKLQFR